MFRNMTRFRLFAFTSIIALLLSACKTNRSWEPEKSTFLRCDPSPIQRYKDSIAFNLILETDQAFPPSTTISLFPELLVDKKYSRRLVQDSIFISSGSANNSLSPHKSSNRSQISIPFRLLYEPELENIALSCSIVFADPKHRKVDLHTEVTIGTVLPLKHLRLPKSFYKISIDNNDSLKTHNIISRFQQGKSDIITKTNQRSWESQWELLKDTSVDIHSIEWHAYASPDEILEFKTILPDRIRREKEYFQLYTKKNRPIADRFTEQVIEKVDWKTMKEMVQASAYPLKKEIIDIIELPLSDLEKATILAEEIQLNSWLSAQVYPQLRRSELILSYTVPKRNIHQLREAHNRNPASLQLEDWERLADEAASSEEKVAVYKEMMLQFPDKPQAFLLLGMHYLNRESFEDALFYLESAEKLMPPSPLMQYNKAYAAAGAKKWVKAQEILESTDSLFRFKNNLMSYVFANQWDFNKARKTLDLDLKEAEHMIYFILDNDPQKALDWFKIIPKTGLAYYFKALAAAKLSDVETLTTVLARSFKLDPVLKEAARNDPNFYSVRNEKLFQVIFR